MDYLLVGTWVDPWPEPLKIDDKMRGRIRWYALAHFPRQDPWEYPISNPNINGTAWSRASMHISL